MSNPTTFKMSEDHARLYHAVHSAEGRESRREALDRFCSDERTVELVKSIAAKAGICALSGAAVGMTVGIFVKHPVLGSLGGAAAGAMAGLGIAGAQILILYIGWKKEQETVKAVKIVRKKVETVVESVRKEFEKPLKGLLELGSVMAKDEIFKSTCSLSIKDPVSPCCRKNIYEKVVLAELLAARNGKGDPLECKGCGHEITEDDLVTDIAVVIGFKLKHAQALREYEVKDGKLKAWAVEQAEQLEKDAELLYTEEMSKLTIALSNEEIDMEKYQAEFKYLNAVYNVL